MLMKILLSADVHKDKNLIYKIIEVVKKEKPDLVVLAGDLTWFGEEDTGGLLRKLKELNVKVIFVPGNHEDLSIAELWEKKYNVINLHGKYIKFGNIILFGFGGGNMPIFNITEEDVKKYLYYLRRVFEKPGIKILVTHVHPHYTFSSKFGEGSRELFKFILKYQPDIHVFGHMHEGSGIEEKIGKTILLNVARTIKILEINDKIKIRGP